MSRNSKNSPEKKLEAVKLYLENGIGYKTIGKMFDVSESTVRYWVSHYLNFGEAGLMDSSTNQYYSPETKRKAVEEYLKGPLSLKSICFKYKIRSTKQLRNWIRVYKGGGSFKSHTGGSYMKKARTTTPEERLKIVTECLANKKNYAAIAQKYHCSYQQVRNWTLKFEAMGLAGLEDRRGRRSHQLPARTPEEELRNKIKELEARNKVLEMELDVLKKVKELERGDACH